MVEDSELEMDERLVGIKRHIRRAQLQTNLIDNITSGREFQLAEISESIRDYLQQALVTAKDVPPIERMISETLTVFEGVMPFKGLADLKHYEGWMVGCTFAMIAAIDFYLEVGQ